MVFTLLYVEIRLIWSLSITVSVHGICPLWRCLSNAIHYGTNIHVACISPWWDHLKLDFFQCRRVPVAVVYAGNNAQFKDYVIPLWTQTDVQMMQSQSNFDDDGACPDLYLLSCGDRVVGWKLANGIPPMQNMHRYFVSCSPLDYHDVIYLSEDLTTLWPFLCM